MPTHLSESGLKPLPEPPLRQDPLVILGQLNKYCSQIDEHVSSSLHKLMLTSQLDSSTDISSLSSVN